MILDLSFTGTQTIPLKFILSTEQLISFPLCTYVLVRRADRIKEHLPKLFLASQLAHIIPDKLTVPIGRGPEGLRMK